MSPVSQSTHLTLLETNIMFFSLLDAVDAFRRGRQGFPPSNLLRLEKRRRHRASPWGGDVTPDEATYAQTKLNHTCIADNLFWMFVSCTAVEVLKKQQKNPKHLIIRSLAIKLSLLFKDRVYFSKGDVTRSCWQYRSFTCDHSIKSSSIASVEVLSFERSAFLFHCGPKTAAQSAHSETKSFISFWKSPSFEMTTDTCCVFVCINLLSPHLLDVK